MPPFMPMPPSGLLNRGFCSTSLGKSGITPPLLLLCCTPAFALSGNIWNGVEQMSVSKRTWKNRDGSQGETWLVAYRDHAGTRRFKNFDKKRDADAYHAEVR